MARWLGSFTDLVGVVEIKETAKQKKARVKRELKRLGYLRFLDVIAFRMYYRLAWQRTDTKVEAEMIQRLSHQYPETKPQIFTTDTPNSKATQDFVSVLKPDLIIARCKVILKPEVFELATMGTFVMHPGICPEYRNSHGCFWALSRRDLKKVGMTLLKIDRGIDTGPIYGYFSYPFDEENESHIVIQNRTVFENLVPIKEKLLAIEAGKAPVLNAAGRDSKTWGQPWLTAWLRQKLKIEQRTSLLYHDVLNAPGQLSGFAGGDADVYKLTQEHFELHLAKLNELRKSGAVFDEPFLLTFDDGGESAHSVIAPILERYGWRGLFFVVTSRIGEPGFLSATQIQDLHKRGHIIGSHSHTHPPRISALPQQDLLAEWKRSHEILKNLLGTDVTTASVPGGYYSSAVADAIGEAGYSILFNSEPESTTHSRGKLKVIGRFGIQASTAVQTMSDLASGQGWARERQWLFWNFKKALKFIGGNLWLKFRKAVYNRQ